MCREGGQRVHLPKLHGGGDSPQTNPLAMSAPIWTLSGIGRVYHVNHGISLGGRYSVAVKTSPTSCFYSSMKI